MDDAFAIPEGLWSSQGGCPMLHLAVLHLLAAWEVAEPSARDWRSTNAISFFHVAVGV